MLGRKKIFESLAAVLVMVFLFFGIRAGATSLTMVKDTISSSWPGGYADHTIQFRTVNAISAGGSIVISPESGKFYIPGLFDASDVDLATAASENGPFTERNISTSTVFSGRSLDFDPVYFPTGAGPKSSVVADLNNDGYDDMAMVYAGDQTVGIFFNDHAGGWLQTYKTTGANPTKVIAGDFNKDGFLDVAVLNSSSHTISIYFNQKDAGFPNFADAVDYAVDSGVADIAPGDLNQDGRLDIAMTNPAKHAISMLKNTGFGTFSSTLVDYAASQNPKALAIADMNNDLYPDIIFTDSSGTVSVMLSTYGSFGLRQDCNTGANPVALAVGDFNKDGFLDIATANYDAGTVSTFLNNGSGSPLCTTRTDIDAGANPASIVAGDFNNDNFTDLGVANYSTTTTSVIINNFANGFSDKLVFNTDPLGNAHTLDSFGDFDQDGHKDLVIAGYNANTYAIWRLKEETFSYTSSADASRDGLEATSDSVNGSIKFILNNANGIGAGEYVRIKIGKNATYGGTGLRQIMNPVSVGSAKINIQTFDASSRLLDRADAMIAAVSPVTMTVATPGRYNETPRRGSVLLASTTQTILSIKTITDTFCRFEATTTQPSPYSTTTIKDYGYNFNTMTGRFDYATSSTGEKFHSTILTGLTDGEHYYAYVRCVGDTDDYQIYFGVEGGTGTGTSSIPGDGTGGTGGGSGGGTGGGTGPGTGSGSGSTGGGGGSGGGSGGGVGAGSGGGSGSGQPYPPDLNAPIVELSGWAYPLSAVQVLKDGSVINEVKADDKAQFVSTINNLAQGVYTFGLTARDEVKRQSIIKNTTFWIKKGTKTDVSDIFIPPTIDLNKTILSKGDILQVFGYSAPLTTVEVWLTPSKPDVLDSDIIKKSAQSLLSGKWQVNFDTNDGTVPDGNYTVKARSNMTRIGASDFSNILSCGIGTGTNGESPCDRADLNHDGKRNLIDFSIMMYHWNTNSTIGDVNLDGKVNLIDFSMLMFCWTG